MKKTFLLIALLLSTAFSVAYVGKYATDYSIIRADNYVLKAPSTLDQFSYVNNNFKIALVPQILINGESATLSPVLNESVIINPQDKYVFQAKSTKNDVTVTEDIEMKAKEIDSTITFTNNGKNAAKVDAIYNLKSDSMFRLFSPAVLDNRTTNYVMVTSKDYYGSAMAIFSSVPFVTPSINLEQLTEWAYGSTVASLPPGGSISFSYTYIPFYAVNSTSQLYPIEASSHFAEPLIKVKGTIDISRANKDLVPSKKPVDMMKTIDSASLSNSEFAAINDVNLIAGGNSMDASEYIKALCSAYDIPCRLIIGKRGTSYYAWLEVYTDHWEEIDPYKKLEVGPTGFTKIYTEPDTEVKLLPKEATIDKSFYDLGGSFFPFQINTLIFYLFVLLLLGGVIYIVRKSERRIRTYTGGEAETQSLILHTETDGKYNIINEQVEDQMSLDLLKRMKESQGVVETAKLAQQLGLSDELVKSSILHMIDNNNIRKAGGTAVQQQIKQKVTTKLFIKNLREVLKEEIKTMTGPQKRALIIIIAVAIILMILMFTLV